MPSRSIGYSFLDTVQEPNAGFVFVRLKPFGQRTRSSESATALIGRVFGQVQRIRAATVFPFNLPPIIGLSTGGGFEYQLEALEGQDPTALGAQSEGPAGRRQRQPGLARVFTTFTATNPSLFLDIDRDKAQALGVNVNDIFTTLQATLGGSYVNDFNLFGRVWQVNVEGEARDRTDITSCGRSTSATSSGEHGAAARAGDLRIVLGPQAITRYNN